MSAFPGSQRQKRKRPPGRKDGGRFLLVGRRDLGGGWSRRPIGRGAGGGAPRAKGLEFDGLAGDRRDVDAVDAEILEFTRGEPHQLVVGLPVLPPVAVSLDEL